MNWGHGITIFFIGFVLFMVSLVVICMRQDNIHLVTENYYEEEINYQQQIEKITNAEELGYQVFSYRADEMTVDLNLPVGAVGTLHLFRPSDARMDQKFAVEMESGNPIAVKLGHLQPGYWKMMLTWKEGNKEFYLEKKITI